MTEPIHATFAGSFTDWKKAPQDPFPVYAFLGRSNVGKSSLINMLCGQDDLAKVSQTPGKTQTINYFLINNAWYLADLPGYGFARVSKKLRYQWPAMIRSFLRECPGLACVFVLVDISITPQKNDLDYLNQLGEWQIPFVVLFTKADKVASNEVTRNKTAFFEALANHWNEMPQTITTSSRRKAGKNEVWELISQINASFYKNLLP